MILRCAAALAAITVGTFCVATFCAQPASAADFKFQRLALHDYEDGPTIPPDYEYLPGEFIWFSARMTGNARAEADHEEETERVSVSWQVRAEDPAGAQISPTVRGLIEETLRAREDKDWQPKFLVRLEVPSFAPRGEYTIRVTAHDDIAGQEATGEVKFRVRGEAAPAPDAAFGVRDFRFLAKQEDQFALQPAVYKQGSGLFTRFEIIGYGFEGNNHFSVEYGLAILTPPNAEGVSKTIFEQPMAAAETSESYYPQRWVPAGFGLNLDPNVAPGEYTLVLTLRDKITDKTSEVREMFTVKE